MDLLLGADESSDSKLSDAAGPVDDSSNDSHFKASPCVDESTSDSVKKEEKESVEKIIVKSASSRVITSDTTHMHIEPTHIIEYEWPPKSGERFFIQEQIAELLDVKSFKRKYPELSRHTIEINEREHLLTVYRLASVINEHQMHGLTAVRAIEVHELMAADYPAIYSEYQKAAADKVKLQMAEQQKQLDAIKMDTKKMEELRKSALRSAFEYNSDLNAIKKVERRHFWDIQTSIIQSSRNRWKRRPPSSTRPGLYPVALICGQFQEYYRKWSPEDLRRLPLGTVVDYERYLPPKRIPSPLPITVLESEVAPEPMDCDANTLPTLEPIGSQSGPEGESTDQEKGSGGRCSICALNNGEQMLVCSNCAVAVHPDCAGLPERVVQVAMSYTWSCIECKRCTVCEKPDHEDAMMFCDRCDRGYHTFCVGLNSPPTGTWVCTNFCANDTEQPRCTKCSASLRKDSAQLGRKSARRTSSAEKLCDNCSGES